MVVLSCGAGTPDLPEMGCKNVLYDSRDAGDAQSMQHNKKMDSKRMDEALSTVEIKNKSHYVYTV